MTNEYAPQDTNESTGYTPYPTGYHVALGAAVGVAFAAHSVVPAIATTVMTTTLAVVPAVIMSWTAKRGGVHANPNKHTPRAMGLSWLVVLLILGLVGAGVTVNSLVDFRWTWALCGVVAFAILLVAGPRIDAVTRRELAEQDSRDLENPDDPR
ncbi:hypothetical protein ACWIGI_26520 [Nocardia sp. NPDC055321]